MFDQGLLVGGPALAHVVVRHRADEGDGRVTVFDEVGDRLTDAQRVVRPDHRRHQARYVVTDHHHRLAACLNVPQVVGSGGVEDHHVAVDQRVGDRHAEVRLPDRLHRGQPCLEGLDRNDMPTGTTGARRDAREHPAEVVPAGQGRQNADRGSAPGWAPDSWHAGHIGGIA